jgi:hypothetical protein
VSVRLGCRAVEADEAWFGLVGELAAMPDAVERLLAEHRPDERGNCRATSCRRPGYGSGYRTWPCSIFVLAIDARKLAERRAEDTDTQS